MGYSKSVYKKAADRLFEQRQLAQKQAEARREEIYSRLPRVRELEQQIALCGSEAVRTVLRGGDAAAEMAKLRDKNLALQAELRELLVSNGYDQDVLEPRYLCKKCDDTGYVEAHGRTVVCTCLKRLLTTVACEELNRTAPLKLCTFESFDTDSYSQTPDPDTGMVPRRHMEKILKYCQSYAQNFTPQSNSILMKGATGLGKTHLSLAIANEVIRRGYSVIYASAPEIFMKMEKEHFSREAADTTFDSLLDCDLLIIDDLGTEFKTAFTTAQVYNLFNSRVLQGKPLIINTNLTMAQLEREYSNRFVSRVNGAAQKLDFLGEDQRIARKQVN